MARRRCASGPSTRTSVPPEEPAAAAGPLRGHEGGGGLGGDDARVSRESRRMQRLQLVPQRRHGLEAVAGSLARARSTMAWSCGGAAGLSDSIGRGVSLMTARRTSRRSLPAEGRLAREHLVEHDARG